jgi:hypothetical protein
VADLAAEVGHAFSTEVGRSASGSQGTSDPFAPDTKHKI